MQQRQPGNEDSAKSSKAVRPAKGPGGQRLPGEDGTNVLSGLMHKTRSLRSSRSGGTLKVGGSCGGGSAVEFLRLQGLDFPAEDSRDMY